MIGEPLRLQYLEAMGLTGWVARYALPHARPTPACEWQLPEAPPVKAPGERLHALLDEAREAPPPNGAEREAPRVINPSRPAMARALLGEAVPASESVVVETTAAEPLAPREALRFTFQAACLEGRWLLLLAEPQPPGRAELKLLGNLLRVAGIAAQVPVFQPFRWPLEEGLPVHEPLEEAREGLAAFVAGSRRRGWEPRRLLLFGHDEPLARVLALEDERCPLLNLPAWQGPALSELAESAVAKREMLPRLLSWGAEWHKADGEVGDEC